MQGSLSAVEATIDRALVVLCRLMALAGGLALLVEIALTTVSVTGRALVPLGTRPVPGDYELIAMASAFAVFCFLPWCQLNRAHARVEIPWSFLGPTRRRRIRILSELAATIMAVLMLQQLILAGVGKLRYGDTSFILEIPVGYGYLVCVPGGVLLVLASAWGTWLAIRHPGHPTPEQVTADD